MTLKDYNKLYWDIVKVVSDCDSFNIGLYDEGEAPSPEVMARFDINVERLMSIEPDAFKGTPTEEEIEKCKYIAAMIDALQDVPATRVDWILKKYKGITDEELEEFILNIEKE